MIIGTNAHAPGLTVRWNDIGDDWASLYAPRVGCLGFVETKAPHEWTVYSFVQGRGGGGVYTRRCDAKRAAEALVGQWWRERCEREATSLDVMLGVVIRGMARRNAVPDPGNIATAKGDDLDRLAVLYGVQRNATTPTEYTFRSEKAEEFAAALGAMANAAREGAESVKGCYDVLTTIRECGPEDGE